MTIRQRYWLQLFALAAGGAAYIVLAIYSSVLWIAGLLAMLVCAGCGLARLECELCGDPLLHREHELFGRDIAMWWPVLPDLCETCDHPVDGSLPTLIETMGYSSPVPAT